MTREGPRDPVPPPSGPRSEAAMNDGWGVTLRYRGRTLGDRRVRGHSVVLGEDPACTFVVPGLGPAATVAAGDTLFGAPGLAVTVVSGEARTPLAGPHRLRPGDRAELVFTAPEAADLTVELRREAFERLPLATFLNPRELVRQLAIGAAVVAAVALLVRVQPPVNTLKLKGDPEADSDSHLVRAMFAVEPPPLELTYHQLYAFTQQPPPPPAPAPMPIVLAAADVVPVPDAEVDAPAPDEPPPRSRDRRKRAESELQNFAVLGVLHEESAIVDVLEGGVEGGVIGGILAPRSGEDLLAHPTEGVVAGAVVSGDPSAEVVDRPGVHIEVVDQAPQPVESDMGPGSDHDDPPPQEAPAASAVIAVDERPTLPGVPGVHSHPADGAEAVRGHTDGLTAVAPAVVCDDPTLARKRQLDVVFVIDVSTTMTFMLDRIEKQIAQVDAEARTHSLDPRYGLVVFVDDVQVANSGQPYTDIAALQRDLATWQAFTASNRQINTPDRNLDWPENTLDALHAAATQYAWRPADTTLRMVVHATDDDFGQAPAVQSGQTVQHGYRETADALRAAEVRMFSFAARIGGQCECLDVRAGLYTRFHGQPSLPEATGGAVFDIDEVAAGKLSFAAAVGGAIRSGVCTRYPLSPFGAPQPAQPLAPP